MQQAFNSPRIDKTCIDKIFIHQFILPQLQRRHSQKDKIGTIKNEEIWIQKV